MRALRGAQRPGQQQHQPHAVAAVAPLARILPHTGGRSHPQQQEPQKQHQQQQQLPRGGEASTSGRQHSEPPTRAHGLPVVHHRAYSAPNLPKHHTFPMKVFDRIHDQLLRQGLVEQGQIHQPSLLPQRQQLCSVHTPEYVDAVLEGRLDAKAMRKIGFGPATATPDMIQRALAEAAGTLLTARLALAHGLACNTAGGTHHAFPGHGSGYCIFNDLAFTAQQLLGEGSVRRVLILDLDVHQGDGTAHIFQGREDVFTMSVHCENNFPTAKQRSSLDVALPDGTGDESYLGLLREALPSVLHSFRPDLVLFDAGVDVHVHDALGRLSLTDEGLAQRERLVLGQCLEWGVPVAGYVGGGYDDDLDVLAQRHLHLHRAAVTAWRDHGL